jgi:phosphoadenosine phosphosulfate reductase
MELETLETQNSALPTQDWLESASAQQILRWAVETYGAKLTMATAFGAEGCAILDMLAKIRDEIGIFPDVFNLDTGYQFGQTLALKAQIEKKYGIQIRAVSPDEGIIAAEAHSKSENGTPLYKSDPDRCCYFRKVVPLKDAVAGFEAWITAIRRDQTPERASAAVVGPDKSFPLIKINPLATWSSAQVWDYIKSNGVPYNTLHDQNFPSIGCWPCTKPVQKGEDDRAGRWAGSEKRECGIHIAIKN